MIIGGSNVDFDTKRQKRDHYRSINHVAVTGPVVQTKWSHVPLTFDARDVDLRSAPHIDAMVINCSVAGWDLHKVLVDNGKQFDSLDFRDFCFSIGTKLAFASVYHPQSNGVVERANGKIFTTIKKMLLDDKKAKWADLLPEAV
jgi:hypothetical protein